MTCVGLSKPSEIARHVGAHFQRTGPEFFIVFRNRTDLAGANSRARHTAALLWFSHLCKCIEVVHGGMCPLSLVLVASKFEGHRGSHGLQGGKPLCPRLLIGRLDSGLR